MTSPSDQQMVPGGGWNPPIPRDVLSRLRELVGLEDPQQTDPLHVKLVTRTYQTMAQNEGNQLAALRAVINWAQRDAGRTFATLKADAEHYVDRETTKLRGEALIKNEKLSRAEAEQIVRGRDEHYQLQLAYLLAEKEEQALRKLLDTLHSKTETWRTNRADDRRGDAEHARGGYTP